MGFRHDFSTVGRPGRWSAPRAASGPGGHPGTFPNGYSYRRALTYDRTQAPGVTSHADFPALVKGTYPYLAHEGNGGRVKHAAGYDIRFEAGGTKLNHEVQRWNATTGEFIAWVLLPSVNGALAGANTTIDLFYGNASITEPEQNPGGTWPDGYELVHHLEQTPPGSVLDSTAHGRHGTTTGMDAGNSVEGLFGKEYDFPGGAGVYYSLSYTLSGAVDWAISCWAKRDVTGQHRGLVGGGIASNNQGLYIGFRNTNALAFAFYFDDLDANPAPDTAYHYYVFARNYSGGARKIYRDGVEIASGSAGTLNNVTSVRVANIPWALAAGFGIDGAPWDGRIEEFRIRSIVPSAERVLAEYNNQTAPGAVWSIGDELIP